MAKHGKVVLKSAGVRALLRSPEVLADLQRRAQAIANAAGGAPDYLVETHVGGERARASVHTETFEAMYDEATERTLTRAIDAGRR